MKGSVNEEDGYLGDRVIDIDGGHLQIALLHHLVQVVDTSRGLL